jgi:hypothetical protein
MTSNLGFLDQDQFCRKRSHISWVVYWLYTHVTWSMIVLNAILFSATDVCMKPLATFLEVPW